MSEKVKRWFIPLASTVLGIVLTSCIAWGVSLTGRITASELDMKEVKTDIRYIREYLGDIKKDLRERAGVK